MIRLQVRAVHEKRGLGLLPCRSPAVPLGDFRSGDANRPSPARSRSMLPAALDLMCRHGGGTSFQYDSRLAECWHDLHAVGQTVTIAPGWYLIGAGYISGWTQPSP
jgi:hypothetical protein